MHPSGLTVYEERDPARSFEQATPAFDEDMERRFQGYTKAWRFWEAQPPGYRKTATWWVVSAKREETRARRLARLIEDSAHGRRLAQLTPPSRRTG